MEEKKAVFPEGGFKIDPSKLDEEKIKAYLANKAEKQVRCAHTAPTGHSTHTQRVERARHPHRLVFLRPRQLLATELKTNPITPPLTSNEQANKAGLSKDGKGGARRRTQVGLLPCSQGAAIARHTATIVPCRQLTPPPPPLPPPSGGTT